MLNIRQYFFILDYLKLQFYHAKNLLTQYVLIINTLLIEDVFIFLGPKKFYMSKDTNILRVLDSSQHLDYKAEKIYNFTQNSKSGHYLDTNKIIRLNDRRGFREPYFN